MTLDPVDRISTLTFEILRHIRKKMIRKQEENTEDCVNMLQMQTLHMLTEHEGATMKEVADFMKVSSPSATSFISRLVKMGWIDRVSDPLNRKLVRLKVTAKGKKLLQEKMLERKKVFAEMLDLLPLEDQQEFARILGLLLDNLRKNSTI
ncbi:MAG: Transcriptional regulator SlyA [Candidatus Peribacteria bacterium]|nr:Transcriptional regulator SlyA [Candidatus Peribacteria bacterium]